ncbi:MAG: Nif3-like dinuclear metal center hexameric protein, partial [Patescibacteria group bacterium]
THADAVRQALGEAGGGKIGNYDLCSFSSRGTGRFRGNENANPSIGEAGKYEAVEEERIEAIVPREILKEAIEKVKGVHPYEEVAFDIYSLEDF